MYSYSRVYWWRKHRGGENNGYVVFKWNIYGSAGGGEGRRRYSAHPHPFLQKVSGQNMQRRREWFILYLGSLPYGFLLSGVLGLNVLELNSHLQRSASRVFIRFKHINTALFSRTWFEKLSKGIFINFFYVLYSTLHALSVAPQIPLFRRIQGWNPGLCDFGIGSQTL